jgi:hypothetical protein
MGIVRIVGLNSNLVKTDAALSQYGLDSQSSLPVFPILLN